MGMENTYNPSTWEDIEDDHPLKQPEYLKQKQKPKKNWVIHWLYEKKVTQNAHLETKIASDRCLLSTYVPGPYAGHQKH